MNAPFRVGALAAAAVSLLLGVSGVARAQDAPPAPPPAHVHRCPVCGSEIPADHCPVCGRPFHDPVDRKLDEVLRREYGDPNGSASPEVAPAPPPPPAPRPRAIEHGDDDHEGKIKLGLLTELSPEHVFDAKVGDEGRHTRSGTGLGVRFQGWIDLGQYLSIEAAFSDTGMRTDGEHHGQGGTQSYPGSPYPSYSQSSGQPHSKSFDFEAVDANVVVHPFACDLGQLDLIVGARYFSGEVHSHQQQQLYMGGGYGGGYYGGSGYGHGSHEKVEAGIPMIGIGGLVRPVRTSEGGFTLELYARTRVGGFSYRDVRYDREDAYGNGYGRATTTGKYSAATIQAEGGVRMIFWETLGVSVGARYEYDDIQKSDLTSDRSAEWRSVGPFIAIFVQI